MSGTDPADVPDDGKHPTPNTGQVELLPLHLEKVVFSKRVRRTLVKAARRTETRDEVVVTDLAHENVVVERIPIGRVVEAVPPVRDEDGVTIMPVVEEEVVVVRRLVLKEEVHLRRVRGTTTHSQTVSVREQHMAVTRTPLDD